MDRKLRIGLLGCGGIAQIAHLPALRKARNVQLVAVCDVARELAEMVARTYDVPQAYDDYGEMLEKADIEAVLVATHHAFHMENCVEAMRSGRHVLCEKPLAMTVEECEEILRVSRETGRQVQLGCMKRYDPGLQFARKFVSEEMGERFSVSGWYCDTVFHGRYVRSLSSGVVGSSHQRRPPEVQDPHLNVLLTHGVHLVDTLRSFGGEIVGVTSEVVRKGGDIASVSLLEFQDGARGTMELICTVRMDWFEGVFVHGEGGSVSARVHFPYLRKGSDVEVYDAHRGEYRRPAMPDSDPYLRQLEAFADALLSGGRVSPDAYDGLMDQKVLAAIHESAEVGKKIKVNIG
ncbi:MAG: gfo/Idh/MocA family oxidoreductase [Candidatus Latescibacterota bacterium]|nr:MAG: gfo/Idh/MocA family oxidoreductase [Candidatus Latescibacterota bacterium]